MENRIKEIREQKGITQTDLARITGLSVGYICHLENGTRTNPSSKAMVKIAKALDKKISEVFKVD